MKRSLLKHQKEDLRPVLDSSFNLCVGSPYSPSLDELLANQITEATLATQAYKYTSQVQNLTIVLYFNPNHQWCGGVEYVREVADIPVGTDSYQLDLVHQY